MAKTNYDHKLCSGPCCDEDFSTFVDMNNVEISENAHPEQQYEHHERMLARFGDNKTGISSQVQRQVLTQSAARVGSMSYNSVLRPANPGHAGEPNVKDR